MTQPPTVGDVIAERVRKYRTERGWSVRRLSDECAKRGAPQLTAASLGNIERGTVPTAKRKRRDVTVEELIVLAYVLDVPPATLTLPIGTAESVEICPGVVVTPTTAFRWMMGEEWLHIGRSLEETVPGAYIRATNETLFLNWVDDGQQRAEQARQMLDGDPQPLVEERRRFDSMWEANPDDRPYYEWSARRSNRPLPGQPISDEEFVAQWRKLLPITYRSRLREYVDALWRAANAGIQVLPTIPRDLYVDIMQSWSNKHPLDGGGPEEIDPLTGLPRGQAAPVRPVLPPNIKILDRDPDGDR